MIPPSSLVFSTGRGWIDLLLRAWTSTDYLTIRLVWCARSASKGDQQPLRPRFLVCRGRRAQGLTRPPLSSPWASNGDEQPPTSHPSGVRVGRAKEAALAYPFAILRSQAATGSCSLSSAGAEGDHPPSSKRQCAFDHHHRLSAYFHRLNRVVIRRHPHDNVGWPLHFIALFDQ